MRRRSALFVLFLVFTLSVVPGAILAQDIATPIPGRSPTYARIGGDGLILYGFTFQEIDEIPWHDYDATMTVYVLAGEFAFYAENPDSEVVIDPPSGQCIKIRDGVQE